MGKKLQLDELGQLGQSGQNVSLPSSAIKKRFGSMKNLEFVFVFVEKYVFCLGY